MKKKAEDILTEDNFSKEALSEASDNWEGTDKEEFQIAIRIYSFLVSGQGKFPFLEKEQTKSRIKSSVRKLNRTKQIKRWPIAASVLVIFCLAGVWYFQMNSTSEVVSFARALNESKPDSDTRLILQDGQEVRISKEHSQISYSYDGKDITIGTDRKVVQKIASQKPVFNTVIVPYGKRTRVTLSEGTKVWLNSGSKLVYPAMFAQNKREVYIDGEAIFEVTPSKTKPFQVSTRDFDIKVLGTVFNVSAYSDDKYSSTVLEHGKVELSHKGNIPWAKAKLEILPGTMAVFNFEQKTFAEQKVNPGNYMSWREGFLLFNSEKLAIILKKISRYYNVEIILQNTRLGNETFSGNLDLKNTPEEILDVIAETTPFIYKFENDKLFINIK